MAAERHYLVEQSRWTLKELTEHVNRNLPDDALPVGTRYVRQVVNELASVDPDHERMLADDAIAGKSFAKKRICLSFPFERVEQDALHLPFVVKTPSGVSSNIYLVHAIECGASYPLGWCLVVGPPTESDTLACAELYMSPLKAERFRALRINHALNVCGTPGQIVFDNGPEARGRRIDNLKKLGVDIKHCRAKEAQGKPFIERLNRSLKEALQGLAGCTRFDGKDGKRDPIALGDRLMTLDELERWIVRWYYEKWIHTPLKRLRWDTVLVSSIKGATPAERWKHHEDSCLVVSLPPSRSEWLAALYQQVERQVSRKTGISVQGLNYKGDDMERLISKYGEHRLVSVLFNQDDFRHVYVYEGDDFPLITLSNEFLTPETPAWSFKEAKEKFKATEPTTAPSEAEQFGADLHAQMVSDSLAPKNRPKRKSQRDVNRETRERDQEARAIGRAAAHPTPLAPPKGARPKPIGAAEALPSSTSPGAGLGLGEATLLPVLNRSSGDRLK